ncbi:MAG: polysaccharide deacetylase family protein, partial [Acidimicrobiales bacterium]
MAFTERVRRSVPGVSLALAGLLTAVSCSGSPGHRLSSGTQASRTIGSFDAPGSPGAGVLGGGDFRVLAGGDFAEGVALETTTTATTAPGPPLGEPGVPVSALAQGLVAHRVTDLAAAGALPGGGGAGSGPVVALTFDDGPDPANTPGVLDVLARYGATSTFFMLGRPATRFPDLVRRVAAAGHSVAGHTWSHVDLTRLPEAQYSFEVDRTDELL